MNFRTIALLAMAATVGCPFQQEENDDTATLAALATLSASSSSLNSATVSFEARDFNDALFNCGNTFAVSSTVSLQPLDLRFYISDVRLVKDDGTTVPVIMTADGKWQSRGAALLDFENKSGTCTGGTTTTDTNTAIQFQYTPGSYTGIQFVLGLTDDLNRIQNTAESPFNVGGMYWSWTSGYKFVRFEYRHENNTNNTLFHLGSQSCMGVSNPVSCAQPFRKTVRLTKNGFSPADTRIVLRLDELLTGFNTALAVNKSCMPAAADADCQPMLNNLKITTAAAGIGAGIDTGEATSVFELR
jgi:uncharacterized repeat protein (TIGR04052 family)